MFPRIKKRKFSNVKWNKIEYDAETYFKKINNEKQVIQEKRKQKEELMNYFMTS